MGRILTLIAGGVVLAGAVYLLADYVLNAPRARLSVVVVAGSVILVGGAAFIVWIWPERRND